MQVKKTKKRNFILMTAIVMVMQLTHTTSKAETIEPEDNQYLELRAVSVTQVDDAKQVTMELWGHNIDFKRI